MLPPTIRTQGDISNDQEHLFSTHNICNTLFPPFVLLIEADPQWITSLDSGPPDLWFQNSSRRSAWRRRMRLEYLFPCFLSLRLPPTDSLNAHDFLISDSGILLQSPRFERVMFILLRPWLIDRQKEESNLQTYGHYEASEMITVPQQSTSLLSCMCAHPILCPSILSCLRKLLSRLPTCILGPPFPVTFAELPL